MKDKPTYAELEARVRSLEAEISHCSQAESHLSQDDSWFGTMVDLMPTAMAVYDDRCFFYVNRIWQERTGYSSAEARRMSPLETVPPEMREAARQGITTRLRDRPAVTRLEMQTLSKHGRKSWIELIASTVDYEGHPAILGISTDITNRKRQEDILAARLSLVEFSATCSVEELLRAFLDKVEILTDSRIGFFHFLAEDQVSLSLQTWSTNTLSNMCRAEGQGAHYHIDQAGVWVDCVRQRRAVIHNDLEKLPHRKGFPKGHAPVVRQLVVPIFRKGNIVAILGVGNKPSDYLETDEQVVSDLADMIWDIVERKQVEIALGESERKYRTLLNTIPLGVKVTDREGKITYSNPAHDRIYGFEKGELVGRHFWEQIADPTEREACKAGYRQMLSTPPLDKQCFSREQTKDGRLIDIQLNWEYIHDSADEKAGMISVISDISDKVRLEQELQHARKMESIGTLAGGIAHDFNNILGIIVGNTELALDDVPEWNPAHFSLAEIKKAGLRAKSIVRQLLSFSRKDSQEMAPMEIVPVIEDALSFLRSTLPTTVTIRKQFGTGQAVVLADPVQLNQIMMNLCINASQAMERTGGVIQVAVDALRLDPDSGIRHAELMPGDYVRISIKDTGPGINPGIIDRIFDPYFTTKEVGKGSGMGLAVVQGIVTAHRGAITVSSRPGQGTVFEIFLPRHTSPSLPREDAASAAPARGSGRILFVDDETAIVNVCRQVLERLGYQVQTALTPEAALRLFKEAPRQYDLVISDMTMPGMTGADLTRQIRTSRPDIPVIICTGYSSLMDDRKARQMGINGFIMKPIAKDELAQAVKTALEPRPRT